MIPRPMRVVSEDDQLLHDLQRGVASWGHVYVPFRSYVEAVSRKLRANLRASEADRQDAVQETFLYLMDPQRPRYAPDRASARTYLYFAVQSAFHVVLDHQRALRRRTPDEPGAPAPDEPAAWEAMTSHIPADGYEDRQFLAHVFAVLNPVEREVLEAVANDRSVQCLSADHGVSRPTMSRMVKRIRQRAHDVAVSALSA